MWEHIEKIAKKLKYPNAFSFVKELLIGALALYALSVVLSLGWQANLDCVTFRPLVTQAKECILTDSSEFGNEYAYYPSVGCLLQNTMGQEYFNASNLRNASNASYWYEIENGTRLQFPRLR